MIFPMLFPEEFISGYTGKLRQFLNLRTKAATIDALRKRFETEPGTRQPNIYWLASAAGIFLEDVVTQHTLSPLSLAFTIHDLNDLTTRELNQTRLRNRVKRHGSVLPQYCPSCVAEDMEFWGISYWRRYHLIRGVDHCLKHQQVKLVSVSAKHPFSFCPQNYLSNAQTSDQSTTAFTLEPYAKRYADICSDLLEMKRPIGKRAFIAVINHYLQDFRPIKFRCHSTLLFDLVVEKSPSEWLSKHFPDFTSPQQRLTFGKSCIAANRPLATELIVLLLAAMFDSATEALSAIHGKNQDASIENSSRRLPHAPRGGNFWKSSEVLDAYVASGFHTNAVAEKFNLTHRATRGMMRLNGLPGLRNALKTKAGEALRIFLLGSSYEDAIRHAGTDRDRFEELVRMATGRLAEAFRREAEGKIKS